MKALEGVLKDAVTRIKNTPKKKVHRNERQALANEAIVALKIEVPYEYIRKYRLQQRLRKIFRTIQSLAEIDEKLKRSLQPEIKDPPSYFVNCFKKKP